MCWDSFGVDNKCDIAHSIVVEKQLLQHLFDIFRIIRHFQGVCSNFSNCNKEIAIVCIKKVSDRKLIVIWIEAMINLENNMMFKK